MNRLSVFSNRMTIALCCLFAFAGCTDDTATDGNRLPDGKYPMTFTAAVDGLTVTRAANTADGEWTTGDKIAVQVSNAASDKKIKEYTPSDISDNSASLTSDDPFYWQTTDETKTVSAWYCGDGSTAAGGSNATAVPESWAVQANQSVTSLDDDTPDAYQQSDFLYAAEKNIKFDDANKSLPFAHQTARVVINIKKGEAATGADVIQSVVIGDKDNLALSGTYTAPTQGSSATGTWNISSGNKGSITPKVITTPSDDGDILKTYAALVIPQDMKDKIFIAITLTDGNTYYYTPTSTDANLESGNQYTYDITVKYGYLDVETGKTNGAWGDGGTTDPVTSKIVAEHFTADDLKIGDYFYRYADGSWATSDGGYRKYTDGSTAVLDIKPVLTDPSTGIARTCIGIVYSTDASRIGATATQALKDKGVNSPHGLVMALTNASEGCRWGYENEDKNSGGNTGEPFKENTDQLLKQYSNIDGYGETHWIIDTYKNSGTTLQDTYSAFYHANRYGTANSQTDKYATPSNTTGWFIPSMGQWWDILSNLGGIDLSSYRDETESYASISGAASTAVDNMNKYLEKINGAMKFSTGTYFWSSSEYGGNYACHVYFYSGDILYLNYDYKSYSTNRVRCSFAF